MKETSMKSQEHIVAVVDPTSDTEMTLDLAGDVVGRGGRATFMVLATRDTIAGINAFADAEELTVPDAREISLERLALQYREQLGSEDATAVLTGVHSSGSVFAAAERDAATVIAMPQNLTTRRGWRTSISRSRVPVIISPAKAA